MPASSNASGAGVGLPGLLRALDARANPSKARILAGFFKTGPGEYGAGDIFLGITVPDCRSVARQFYTCSLGDIRRLLGSRIHEHRLVALLLLISRYQRSGEKERRQVFDFYLKNTAHINNWDLVDLSAPQIVGSHLRGGDRSVLYTLACSRNLWERRIAIVATLHFIRNNQFRDTLRITRLLLQDEHDLIHKAVGWMLREVGKRNPQAEERFLRRYHRSMPRTMLRYAIERFSPARKGFYRLRSGKKK